MPACLVGVSRMLVVVALVVRGRSELLLLRLILED